MNPSVYFYLLLPFVAWGVLCDIANTANGGSIDLRNRVTGARIASAKLEPYTFEWSRDKPEEFLDLYNEPGGLMSKTTVTPWILALHAPLNSLNYAAIQWLWFLIQYLALGLIILAWIKCCRENDRLRKWGLVIILLYTLTPSWRHHVDHGQIYVVYGALFMALYWLGRKERSQALTLCEGALGAFTLGSRPIFLGQFAAPFKEKRWLLFAGTAGGLVLVFLVPLLLFRNSIWSDYRFAMNAHSEIYLNEMKVERSGLSYPGTIESIPLDRLAGFKRDIPFADTSIFKLLSYRLPPRVMLIGWALLMGGALLFMARKKASSGLIWWAAASWIIVGDFLLPAFRHNYNDVLALPMILFGILALETKENRFYWICASLLVIFLMFTSFFVRLNPSALKWYIPMPTLAMMALAMVAVVWSLVLTHKASSAKA